MMEYVRTRYTRTLAELMEEDNFQLFDFDYTFPEGHKEEMENYVINWFSEDEIGAETPSTFKRMFIPLFMKHIPLCAQMVEMYDRQTELDYTRKEEYRDILSIDLSENVGVKGTGKTDSHAENKLTEQDTPVNPIGANEQYASFKSATNSDGDSTTTSSKEESRTKQDTHTNYGEKYYQDKNFTEIMRIIEENWQNPYGWLCEKLAPCFLSLML